MVSSVLCVGGFDGSGVVSKSNALFLMVGSLRVRLTPRRPQL